jgi:hydrogenase-4 component B
MQYTGRAFSELLTARVLPRWIRGQVQEHETVGPFPTAASFRILDGDPMTRSLYEPSLVRCGDRFARLRVLQQGNVHIYLLYIVATAIIGLGWIAARDWFSP